jgi:hypothetical protein
MNDEGLKPIEAYPLCWPENRPRTQAWNRERARFDMSFARARDEIVRQIELMCGKYPLAQRETGLIISTNIALRRDGLPLASQRQPEDPGVAVYFTYKKRPMCFACDRWQKVEDNMQAIAKTIDALRGIARWGTGDMMEAAFTGFTALPAPGKTTARGWREVLGFPAHANPSAAEVEREYKQRRSKAHPDHGGNEAEFNAVQIAYQQAMQEIGG